MTIAASTTTTTALYTSSGIGIAECWTFALATGTVNWTSYSSDVAYGGTTWLHDQAGITKGKLFKKAGTEIDSLEVTLFGTVTIGGAALVAAGCGLAFSEVHATYSRVYFPSPGGAASDRIVIFDGIVQATRPETASLVLEIKSPLSAAPQNKGTRLIQTSCPFSVNDTDCGAAAQDATGTVAAGSTVTRVNLAALPSTAVAGSRLTFTSGALNGVAEQIRATHASAPIYVDLVRAVASIPAAGVTVTVRRGCDKTRSTCSSVFSNIARYGGCPDMPVKDLLP